MTFEKGKTGDSKPISIFQKLWGTEGGINGWRTEDLGDS